MEDEKEGKEKSARARSLLLPPQPTSSHQLLRPLSTQTKANQYSRSVPQSENNILQSLQPFSIRKLRRRLLKQLHELNRVVRRLSLSISRHHEHDGTLLGDLIELLEVVLLDVAYERRDTEPGLDLFGDSSSVLLGCSSLRTVEDGETFFL